MSSLRSRIAISCVALLLATVIVVSYLEVVVFRSNLFHQRDLLHDAILNSVEMQLDRGEFPKTLDRWGSPNIFVQIDERLSDGRYRILEKSSEHPQSHHHLRYDERDVTFKGRRLTIRIASDMHEIDQTLAYTQVLMGIFTLLVIPVVIFISVFLSGRMIRPVNELIRTVRLVNPEQLDQRVGLLERNDELGELARNFDAMLDRLREGFERERRFIADASHEIKTPLTVIHSNAQMLRRWAQSDERVRSESIDAIIDESKGLTLLVEELLLLARIDAGGFGLQELIDLRELCGDLLRSTQSRITTDTVTLALETDDPTDEYLVLGNRTLLRRTFGNLVDNAVKFTHEGNIVLRLERSGEIIRIVVSDTGIGIPEDELQLVFERLYRSDRARTRQVEGFGLGLSIARAFVELHRGRIYASPGQSQGARVCVELPTSPALA